MSSDPAEKQHLPPWLRDLPLPLNPRVQQPEAPRAELGPPLRDPNAQIDSSDLPSWMRDLSSPTAPSATSAQPKAEAQTDLPAWLPADPPAPPMPRAPTSSLPPWLAPGPPPAEPNGDVAPSWLPSPDSTTQPADAIPSWLGTGEGAASPAERQVPAQTGDDNVPDWLSASLGSLPTTPAPALQQQPAPSDTIPGWLAALGGTSEPAANTSGTRGTESDDMPGFDAPSWLSAAEPSAAAPTPPAAETVSDADALPSWLRAEPVAEPALPAAAPLPPDAFTIATSPSADALPSWLHDAAVAEPAAPASQPPDTLASPPSPGAGALPSWLRGDAAAPSMPAPSAAVGGDALPAWLRDDSAPQPAGATPAANPTPTWRRDDAPSTPPATIDPLPATAPAPGADALPSWLRDDAVNAAPTPPAPPAADALPSWLRDDVVDAAPAASAAADDLPSWLRDNADAAAAGAPQAPVASPASAIPAEILPAWLNDDRPTTPAASDVPSWLRADDGQQSAGGRSNANLPAWLQDAPEQPPTSAPATSPIAAAPATPASPIGNWFDTPAAPAAPAAPAQDDGGFLGATELPPWLRTEREAPPAAPTVDLNSVVWLTHSEVTSDESPAAEQRSQPIPMPTLPARSADQIAGTSLLSSLVAAPFPQPAAVPQPAPKHFIQRIGLDRLLSLLLLIALVAGIVVPNLTGSFTRSTTVVPVGSPTVDRLSKAIDSLGPNDVVLVSYDWDVRRIAELSVSERAVLDHLIAQKVKFVLMSTNPQGALLLYNLRDTLTAAGYRGDGVDYVLVGYRPGGDLVLRQVGRDLPGLFRTVDGDANTSQVVFNTATNMPRLTSVRDFSLVLVLADEPGFVQGWMEQVYPLAHTADRPSPLFAFLLTAETAAVVQPYASQADIAMMSGYEDALAYGLLSRAGPQATIIGDDPRIGIYRLGLAVLGALLLVGLISASIGRARRRSAS